VTEALTIAENGTLRERRCIVTGEVLPESKLVRFVVGPESKIVTDIAAKLPGRGLWVRADSETITKAVARNMFSRAAQAQVKADIDLSERTERLLAAHMLNTLGLARRAGELIQGFEKIETALRGANPPAIIIEASDASSDGRRKIEAAAYAKGLTPFVIGCFSSDELGLALGLENVIHAGVKAGRFAERLIFDAGRLKGFRSLKPWANGQSGREQTSAGRASTPTKD
jgi:predicted RNA-binding protein YlxR (DUF448 family)